MALINRTGGSATQEYTFLNKTCFFLISDATKYIPATLSSKLFEFAYKKFFPVLSLAQAAINTDILIFVTRLLIFYIVAIIIKCIKLPH